MWHFENLPWYSSGVSCVRSMRDEISVLDLSKIHKDIESDRLFSVSDDFQIQVFVPGEFDQPISDLSAFEHCFDHPPASTPRPH